MKKKFLLALTLIAMVAVLFAISVSATDPVETWDVSASEDNNVIAHLYEDETNKGCYTLTISGTGAMKDWSSSSAAPWWSGYRTAISKVTVNDGITSIGDRAFFLCYGITEVVLPESLTTIGHFAFADCSSLTSIEIADGVTSIGNSAFAGAGLVSVTIPKGVTIISENMFSQCHSLTEVEIHDGVIAISTGAFNKCGSLISIFIPDSVTSIGYSVFENCTSLTNISVDENNQNYKSISGNLYNYSCDTLIQYAIGKEDTSFVIPDGVTSIGYAFSTCKNLKSITISDSVTTMSERAFYSCSGLESITIPDSITTIPASAFYRCTSLKSVELSINLTSIDNQAFASCVNLASITIHDGVTSIGASSFEGCSSLISIFIPDSVEFIGEYAFMGCTSLAIYCEAESQPTGWDWAEWNPDDRPVVWGFGQSHEHSYTSEVTIEPTHMTVGEMTYTCECGDSYTEEIAKIEEHTFVDGKCECGVIEEITDYIEKWDVSAAGDGSVMAYLRAYPNCSDYYTLIIIGTGDMADWSSEKAPWYSSYSSKIVSVTVESGVTKIGNNAFYGCINLASATICEGVTTIGNYAFEVCYNLTDIIIPNGVVSIGNSAFSHCYCLKNIELPDSVTSIGDCAFFCSSLSSIIIPDSVVEFGNDVFLHCIDLVILCEAWVKPDTWGDNWNGCGYLTDHETGEMLGYNLLPVLWHYEQEHIYTSETIKEPTIVTNGEIKYTCECGEYYVDTISPEESEHSYYIDWGNSVSSTCVEQGYWLYVCDHCGDAVEVQAELDTEYGHLWNTVEYTPASCVLVGYLKETCEYCGEIKIEEFYSPNAYHEFAQESYMYDQCNLCGKHVLKDEIQGSNEAANGYTLSFSENTFSIYKNDELYHYSFAMVDEACGYCPFIVVGCTSDEDTLGLVGAYGCYSAGDDFASVSLINDVKTYEFYFDITANNAIINGIYGGNKNENAIYKYGIVVSFQDGIMTVIRGGGVFEEGYAAPYFYNPISGTITTDTISLSYDSETKKIVYSWHNPLVLITEEEIDETITKDVGVLIGSLDVETTDTYSYVDLYTFVAEIDGTYTFVVPANLGLYSKAACDSFDLVEVDFSCNEYGAYVTVELVAGESYDFFVGSVEKGVWTIDVYCIPSENHTEHTYTSSVTIEPTHTTVGEMTYTCPCGDSYTEEIAKTEEHTYNSVVTIEPTHTTVGEMTYTCECGDSYTEKIAKTEEHTFTGVVTIEPTHMTVGEMTYTCECGDSYTEEIEKIQEHTFIDGSCECGEIEYMPEWDISATENDSVIARLSHNADNKGYYILTISGSGNMKDWDVFLNTPWYKDYANLISTVVIEDGILNVGSEAFGTAEGLTSVSLGNTITVIGKNAFSFCTNLVDINLPYGLTIIGNGAFEVCQNVGFVIPSTVTTIGDFAFVQCAGIIDLNIPNSVVTIGESAFNFCYSMRTVTIPSSVKFIGDDAFIWCDSLASITVDDGNTEYKSIDGCLYTKDGTVLIQYPVACERKSFKVPDGVVTIYNGAFYLSIWLEQIVLPDSLVSIGEAAFYQNYSLTSIIIPSSVTEIGADAFNGCDNLTIYAEAESQPSTWDKNWNSSNCPVVWGYVYSHEHTYTGVVTIEPTHLAVGEMTYTCECGDSYTEEIAKIATHTFINYACECGTTLYTMRWIISATVDDKVYAYLFKQADDSYRLVIEGTGNMIDWDSQNDVPWLKEYSKSITSASIANGVTNVGAYSFYQCERLADINMADSITKIGKYAFYGCGKITKVKLPYEIIEIGPNSFENCFEIFDIEFPWNNLQIIGPCAFTDCIKITDIRLPDSLIDLGEKAFKGCSSLINVILSPAIKIIEKGLFEGCISLPDIEIPDGVVSIDADAFKDCIGLTSVILGETLYKIGEGAFSGCQKLGEIMFPDSLMEIYKNAFKGCISLLEIILPNVLTNLQQGAFEGCTGLTKVTLPENVTEIEEYAFAYCVNLREFVVSGSIETIGQYAFAYCSNLRTIIIPNSVTSIGQNAFLECESLTIYAEAFWQPSTWHIDWNPDPRPVVWKYGHTCQFGEWEVIDNATHQRICICGDLEIADHNFTVETVVSATCTEPGQAKYSCMCGYVGYEVILAKGHSYITKVTAPTCTAQGYTTYTCGNCADTYKGEYVDALGHDYDATVTLPSCFEQGYTTYECKVCKDTYVGDYTELEDHQYVDNIIDATCTEQGYIICSCVICGDVSYEDVISPYGHDYNSVVTTEPTHTTYGVMTYTCNVCGDSYTEKIEKTPEHTYNAAVTAPTCTEKGYTTYTCECGDSYISEYVDALGHDYNSGVVTTEPTHTTYGVMTYTCNVCGDTYTEKIEKTPEHTYNSSVTAPTCTEKGYTTYTCECGDSYISEYVDALGHDYNSGVITTEPTHTTYGVMTYTCNVCGDSYTERIEKTPEHTYISAVTAPTCTEKGYTTYTCECGDSYEDDFVDELGHDYNSGVVTTEPTHTTYGVMTYTCNVCGATYTEDIEKTPEHTYNPVVTLEPTHFVYGELTYVCACGDFYTEQIDKLPEHEIVDFECLCGYKQYVGKWDVSLSEEDSVFAYLVHNAENSEEYTLVFRGTGKMKGWSFYAQKEAPWTIDYNSNITRAVVERGVTNVATYTFVGCRNMAEVVLSDTVEVIEESAFYYCYAMSSIVIPKSVTTIEPKAFETCVALSDIKVDKENENYCSIDGNLYTKDTKTLVQYALGKNEESFDIPAHVEHIGERAFYYSNIQSILIPANVITIGNGAFDKCCDLNKIELSHGLVSIGNEAFSSTAISELIIPDSVTEIGAYAFSSNDSLCYVEVGSGLTVLRENVLADCYSLNSVLIGENVTTIEWHAFSNNASLQSIRISDKVTTIAAGAFSNCSSLVNIEVDENNQRYCSIDGNLYSKDTKTLEIYTMGKTSVGFVVPSFVDKIGSHAFDGATYLEGVYVRENVTVLDEYAFYFMYSYVTVFCEADERPQGWDRYWYYDYYMYTEVVWGHKTHTAVVDTTDNGDCTHTGFCKCGMPSITSEHFYEGVVTLPPTHTEYGVLSYMCVCGVVSHTEPIEKTTEHIFGVWSSVNDTTHQRECACGEYERAPHSFDYGVVTAEPSHESNGERAFTCKDCGYVRTEVIAKQGHSYTIVNNGDGTHTRKCDCGVDVTESHIWSNWKETEDESISVRDCACGARDYLETEKEDDKVNTKPNKDNVEKDKNKDKIKIDVVFDVPTLEMIGVQIIPEIMEQLNNMETEINTDLGQVILDAIASSKVAGQEGAVNIGIQDITTDHEAKTGHRVFNITVNDENGNPILPPSEAEDNGTVTLSFKYHKGLTKDQVKIAYRDENGKLEHMEVEHYDPETGEVRFKTSHLSEYVIYTEEIEPSVYLENIFEFKGYSINETTGQISFGFTINYDAINAYEEATGTTLDYGIVFASYELLGGKQPLDAQGNPTKLDTGIVIKSSLTEYSYTSYDFVLMDITEGLYSHRFTISAYAYTGDTVKYYQENGASDTVSGISYNEVKAAVKE